MVSDRLPARGIPHRCFDARGRLVHSPAHDPIEPNTDLEKLRDVGYCLVPGGLDPDLRGRLNDLLESLPPRDGMGQSWGDGSARWQSCPVYVVEVGEHVQRDRRHPGRGVRRGAPDVYRSVRDG